MLPADVAAEVAACKGYGDVTHAYLPVHSHGYDRFRYFREGAERAAAAAPTSPWVLAARAKRLPAKEYAP